MDLCKRTNLLSGLNELWTLILHEETLRGCKNVVVSSVMEVFVRSEEYKKAYDFANVKPCDNNRVISEWIEDAAKI